MALLSIVSIGVGAAIVYRAFVLYQRLQRLNEGLYPQPLRITAADFEQAQRALGAFDSISLRTQDGLTLRAWYKPSSTGAAVIFIHGKSNNRHVMLHEAAAVARRGIGVLLYDSRASGDSDGQLHSWGHREQLDLVAALDDLVERPEIEPGRIGVYGFSVGANTALLRAVQDLRIRALILSGACPSLMHYLRHISSRPRFLMAWLLLRKYRRAGIPVEQIDLTARIAEFSPRPLLMVRGTGSVTVPVTQVQALFDAAREPKEMLVIQGADHNDYVAVGGEPYLEKVASFFENHLTSPSVKDSGC